MVYGYCRISTDRQNIERQIRNILKAYPDAVIKQEVYTGTKTDGRKVFEQLLKIVRAGDTIVFDSVSRMSRNAEAGFEVYQKLYDKSVELVFLKEPHINTETYKKALSNNIAMTGTKTDIILKAINEYLMELAKEQIIIAFEQSEKEVSDLHQRTKEGIETARRKGKQIGRKQGAAITTKKSIKAKQEILKYSRDFNGTLTDVDCMRMIGIARNTYYRYKAELKATQIS
ncbi:MAG: recombinase family protein [Clostridia bacterium]|nr:recombinase family protein [Clostridia bacterium]